MPAELRYSLTSTALAMRSRQSTGKGEETVAQESVAMGRISDETPGKLVVQGERRTNSEKHDVKGGTFRKGERY